MFERVRRTLRDLRTQTSGNATLLVAVGLPAIIGGSGLAVDMSQWYMWKREMQYAVDQAALAGAWAKTSSDTNVQATYVTRATQEYNANVAMVTDFDTTPTVVIENYNGGTLNSVLVSASATRQLPFSSFLTARSTTVAVGARATFAAGAPGSPGTPTTIPAISACMVSLDPSSSGAFTIGGNSSGTVSCGGATLSTHPSAAIEENGDGGGNAAVSSQAQFGTLSAAGGIEGTLLNNVNNVAGNLRTGQTGMTNPYAGITTPAGSGVAQTYTCPTAADATASVTSVTSYQYLYFVGANSNATTPLVPAPTTAAAGYLVNPADDAPVGPSAQSVPFGSSNGVQPISGGTRIAASAVQIGGSGSAKQYRVKYSYVTKTYSGVTGGSDGISRPQPGTYSSLTINCSETIFAPGIYRVTGALDFSSNQTVTGNGVMFVLPSGGAISNINSNTNLTLSGITSSMLSGTYGYSAANASKLAGMLLWDPLGTDMIHVNGNSVMKLNGTLYTPARKLKFNGTASVSGNCLMLVASQLEFTGTVNMSSFCTPSGTTVPLVREESTTPGVATPGTPATVRLVG